MTKGGKEKKEKREKKGEATRANDPYDPLLPSTGNFSTALRGGDWKKKEQRRS